MKRKETHRDPPLPCLSGRVHSNHGGIFIIPAPAPAATARHRHGRGKSSTLNFSEERSSPSTAWYSLASGRCLLPAAPSSPARQPFYNDFFCVLRLATSPPLGTGIDTHQIFLQRVQIFFWGKKITFVCMNHVYLCQKYFVPRKNIYFVVSISGPVKLTGCRSS